jgi:uncharacterized membrane protein YidH (DUF202 family)
MSQEGSESGDPRVGLARNRTSKASFRSLLALDRTTLAWVRTTLTMASFGFGMVAFFRTIQEKSPTPEIIQLHRGAIRMGTSPILLRITAMVLASFSHWSTLRRLRPGEAPILRQWPSSTTIAMLSTVIGLAGL